MAAVYGVYGVGEKPSIVLDVGHCYVKAGFSSEIYPRVFVPSCDLNLDFSNNLTVERWRQVAHRFLKRLFFEILSVDPKERKIVVCDDVIIPQNFRVALSQELVEEVGVPALVFINSQVACLHAIGTLTGLVIDIGHETSQCMPIFDGCIAFEGFRYSSLAGKVLMERTGEMMVSYAKDGREMLEMQMQFREHQRKREILEDVVMRCCFVGQPLPNDEKQVPSPWPAKQSAEMASLSGGAAVTPAGSDKTPFSTAEDVWFPLDDGKGVHIAGAVRERAAECLFQSEDDITLQTMVLDSLLACPRDLRRSLLSHVVVCGGTSMLPGMCYRLLEEVKSLMISDPKYKTLKELPIRCGVSEFPPNCVQWVGGGIAGTVSDIKGTVTVTPAALEKSKYAIPDWSRISHTVPTE